MHSQLTFYTSPVGFTAQTQPTPSIPSDDRLNAYVITRDEFNAIVNHVDNMGPISKNTIIKKSESGLPFTIACVPDVNAVSITILFKKRCLYPIAQGGVCSVTHALSARDDLEVVFRSAEAKRISIEERIINCLLYQRKDLFVVGNAIFDYRGPCARGKVFVNNPVKNINEEIIPLKRDIPEPQTDTTNDNRPIFDKTGIILERMDGSALTLEAPTPEIALHIFREVLKCLLVLHEEFQLVHMDLKLDNILLKGTTVKIGDFGHTKTHGIPIRHQFTLLNVPPEVIKLSKKGELASCRADYPMDMWSFGVANIQMMCFPKHAKMWTFHWDLVSRKMRSGVDAYDFNNLVKGFLDKFKSEIESCGDKEYLKIFPLLEKCLQIDPEQRITCREALKLIEELV